MLGEHVAKSWSTTQAVIALSSGEAEYYGIVKGSSVGLGARSVLRDLGCNVRICVMTDSSAAVHIGRVAFSMSNFGHRRSSPRIAFLWNFNGGVQTEIYI